MIRRDCSRRRGRFKMTIVGHDVIAAIGVTAIAVAVSITTVTAIVVVVVAVDNVVHLECAFDEFIVELIELLLV